MLEKAIAITDEIAKRTDEVILFHSASGKDSIALLDICAPRFKRVVCVFMYVVKGMEHINRYISYAKKKYPTCEFVQIPHFAVFSYIKYGYMGHWEDPNTKLQTMATLTDMVRKKTGIQWALYGFKQSDSLKLRLILNFILSPALIVYTVILYAYFIKIVFEWDLPKGGVAWMVMAFIAVDLVGRVAQSILNRRYFDGFYRRFTLIAILPLVMYWIGSIYRIRLYSFTESRFYLMVAGVLMTLFVLMLFKERTRRYQLMALIFGAAIILFTYIPGISAKRIGLECQKQRLAEIISELKLNDAETGRLNDEIDMRRIKQDSLLCEKYKDASSVIDYVRDGIGSEEFLKQYGEWTHSEYEFDARRSEDASVGDWHKRKKSVELGDYSILLPEGRYNCSFDGKNVTVRNQDAVVLEYPINSLVRKDIVLLHRPEQLFIYRNDSLLLVLQSVCIKDTVVTDVGCYNFQVFRKQVKQ